MNVVLKPFLGRSALASIGRLMACSVIASSLIACSSSEKDYSDATPLSTIDTRIKVVPLWARLTGDVPKSAHAQLPVKFDGGRLYLANRRGEVAVLDARTGKLDWQVKLGEALSVGSRNPQSGKCLPFPPQNAMCSALCAMQDGG